MRVSLSRAGLYVALRLKKPGDYRDALGFVIKPASAMIFSERHGDYRHALRIGPIYARTYARKATTQR